MRHVPYPHTLPPMLKRQCNKTMTVQNETYHMTKIRWTYRLANGKTEHICRHSADLFLINPHFLFFDFVTGTYCLQLLLPYTLKLTQCQSNREQSPILNDQIVKNQTKNKMDILTNPRRKNFKTENKKVLSKGVFKKTYEISNTVIALTQSWKCCKCKSENYNDKWKCSWCGHERCNSCRNLLG